MTEQGETIAQKYSHLGSATYHLEILHASAAATTAKKRKESAILEADRKAFNELAGWSREAYRGLLQAPGFLQFHRRRRRRLIEPLISSSANYASLCRVRSDVIISFPTS